jgi:hypothetical protein
MRNLENRLERLEVQSSRRGKPIPRYLQRYFKALENFDRAKAGLEPLPYTEEDREEDERFLLETLLFYRASPGWQTEEAQHVLDTWERDIREKHSEKEW